MFLYFFLNFLLNLSMKDFCQRIINTLNRIEIEQWQLLQKRAITPRQYGQAIAESQYLKRDYQEYLDTMTKK